MSIETNSSPGNEQPTLNRVLGLTTGILLVAGMMIGSGVFKKIVPMAQTGLSETWILLAWAGAGIITMFGAFTLAGLASLTEESGGVYEYLRLSFGNFFSFIFGWTDFSIIGTASVAALGFIFAQTVNVFIPLGNPFHSLEHLSIGGFVFPFAEGGIKLLAISAIVLLTWINYRGIQHGGLVNNIVTSAKILGILLLIVLGLSYSHTADAQVVIAAETTAPLTGVPLLSAVLAAMLSAFWAYDGWSNISFITGEIKNPKRNIPIAIMSGVAIAMSLYLLANAAYMHVLPLSALRAVEQTQIGAAVVAETLLGKAGQTLLVALIMVSVFGSLNGIILAHARIYFRMAQGGFFFKHAAKVHPVHRTPSVALLYTMTWSSVLVMSGTFDMLTDMVIFVGFLFYGLVAVALFKMKSNGSIKVKVIGYPVIPAVIILFSLALVINTVVTHPKHSLIGSGLVLIGMFFYFYFKHKKSNTV
ncbi:APC family permease [Lacibacter sediminis]|uniref:Amino acid permease n=1 Tax=Lacibacter sediminis TaxID=2760713 RepID=A0A7G5XGE7_9BACT|nr:amino acid permease [Lacibacter sediminis]QNA44550.1 amino acid permease [Lacibacter sediminis]